MRLRPTSCGLLCAGALVCAAVAAGAPASPASPALPAFAVSAPLRRLLDDAAQQTRTTRLYDPAYVAISYPGGDVPRERGICADVIVRAFRAGGVDLQRAVHEDMRGASFGAYPKLWGLRRPDANIDHRRVANLMTYFARRRQSRPVTPSAAEYRPADVVAWRLPGGRLHIGLVTDRMSPDGKRPLMIHNIGEGARQEDVLFAWTVIGHYRGFE